MKLRHFETYQPICPVCRTGLGQTSPLKLAMVIKEEDDQIIEGLLHCENNACQREYPIIDGIPLIIKDIRAYVSDNAFQLFQRYDLSDVVESVLGDCLGQGATFDAVRQHLSGYTWDHYGDLDPSEPNNTPQRQADGAPVPGSMLRLLKRGVELANLDRGQIGPIMDVGCSVGRGTFALAEHYETPVLGIDLNFPMLRIAGRVLREGIVRYPRRRVGIVYDRHRFPVSFKSSRHVDFWACDATALPFMEQQFDAVFSMNLLDCVHSPLEMLTSLASVLKTNGTAVIACPYDWSSSATAIEGWIGGHSQRGTDSGASESILQGLLAPGQPQSIAGMSVVAQENRPWHVRLHERSHVRYESHLIVSRKH